MNESNNNRNRYSWLGQLLISIFGTAIGVGLTFFANNLVEKKHQQAAQRETAIMAVCDIDEIVQGLKEEAALEDRLFKVAMYVWSHQERIDSFPLDTLNMTLQYLYDNPMAFKGWTADTKEKAFNSGIDTRMNIGNNQFYDNVQSCYYQRRSLEQLMAEAPVFRRPVSIEEREEFMQKLSREEYDFQGPSPDATRKATKQFISQGATALYIKRYIARKEAYGKVISELERMNSENKLLMEITDEDIEAYIKRNTTNVSGQNPADLIVGEWDLNLNDGRNTYVFRENNTFERIVSMENRIQLKQGQEQKEMFLLVPTDAYVPGRWKVEGDKLILEADFSKAEIRSIDLDVSSLPETAAMDSIKASWEIHKGQMKDYYLEMFRQQDSKAEYVISFDRSGNTMVWTKEETTATGQKQSTSMHLYRKF